MKVSKIYFDMDGVLADFDRGIVELCHLQPKPQGMQTEADNVEMFEAMRLQGNFYDKLEVLPGAAEMFNMIYERYGDKCEVLTGIPKPRRGITTASEDKTNWMRRKFGADIVMNIVYRSDKKNFCLGEDYILIDDYDSTIAEWEARGGIGIVHHSAEETIRRLTELGVL